MLKQNHIHPNLSPTNGKTKPGISYQGEPGANSHMACQSVFPDMEALPCATFEGALSALAHARAEKAMIPVENSVAGRVADIHHLLPDSGLYIVGEHFQPVHHQLLALPGTRLEDLKSVHSHIMALGQCRKFIKQHGLEAITEADTAGAARVVKELGNPDMGAIASDLAADIYGLDVLAENIEDEHHNTTRFLILARDEQIPRPEQNCMMSFVFRVRNVPAALYKALGGFATNGVNMTKLESYQPEGRFNASMFYADIEGHPDMLPVRRAMDELNFFTDEIRILGTYPAHSYREKIRQHADV